MNLAQTLLADPTFSLMSRSERIQEAMALLTTANGDADPIEAAIAVEEAEAMAERGDFSPVEAVQAPRGVEPCREDRQGCGAPVAGNGRCIECGAQRVAAEGLQEFALLSRSCATAAAANLVSLAAQSRPKPSGPILSRFREATGNKDREIADMIGLARSSVQAIAGGRVGENLAPSQLQALRDAAAGQVNRLQDLIDEIDQRISG